MSEARLSEIDAVVASLMDRWNAGDADGFATNFTEDADFVDVLGRYLKGRSAIADIHRRNFATIHAGSTIRMSRRAVRELADGLAIAHADSGIVVPAGLLAGESRATQSMVLTHQDRWLISAFHNTTVRELAGVPQL